MLNLIIAIVVKIMRNINMVYIKNKSSKYMDICKILYRRFHILFLYVLSSAGFMNIFKHEVKYTHKNNIIPSKKPSKLTNETTSENTLRNNTSMVIDTNGNLHENDTVFRRKCIMITSCATRGLEEVNDISLTSINLETDSESSSIGAESDFIPLSIGDINDLESNSESNSESNFESSWFVVDEEI